MGFKSRARGGEVFVVRVYDEGGAGPRFLVDRVWPRGVRREALRLEAWLPEVAPSTALRKAYAHDPARWPAFVRDYHAELEAAPERWRPLVEWLRAGPITLLYSARDRAQNQAVALRDFLLSQP